MTREGRKAVRLASIERDGWQLESAEARHAAHPESFQIPASEARKALAPGDGAKLLFLIETVGAGGSDRGVERMWVIVRRRAGGLYLGVLDSTPRAAGLPALTRGCEVVFAPEHVADIERPSRSYVIEHHGRDFFDSGLE